ncbi:MAG: hypothetical protein AMJ69_10165 [Gammaproteobacteria bacterium SG8_47]|nr:MAG: hypothetical protein AMJ69_10165 [Gammaproteobacteria bacterium SG8_47]
MRVLILGTGQMGSGIARLVVRRPGLELVGAYGRRAQRAGMDVGPAIGLNQHLGIVLSSNLDAAIERARPDIAIQATCSTLDDALPEITSLVRHGVAVISIAEEMVYPAATSPAQAKQLHSLAIEHGVAVLGAGINPGFVLDLLIIALTGVCTEIESITATRTNDLSPFGSSVLTAQGVGLTPEAFRLALAQGGVVGHYGFAQSIHMIARAVGWDIERIEETREPIVARVRRETPFTTVEPGQVAGCHQKAVAYRNGKPVITLIHPQQVHPEVEGVMTGDRIHVRGAPEIVLTTTPEIAGGEGTIALAVNMIPRVLNAPPGSHTMIDLPVPAAVLADARTFVAKARAD